VSPPRAHPGPTQDFVAINTCDMVDLTGQVASESVGLIQFSATGGKPEERGRSLIAIAHPDFGEQFLAEAW
jgi:acyl-CoA hydrolase